MLRSQLFLVILSLSSLVKVRSVDSNNNESYSFLSSLNASAGLVWQDLTVYNRDRIILVHPFNGHIANGRICGVLGPSGSGKTSFLTTLASLQTLPTLGTVYHYELNSQDISLQPIHPKNVAWLQQKDVFFNMLTVRETLQLAAFLELPHVPVVERDEMIRVQLQSLGLAHAAHRQVGGDLGTGSRLSGGERRRVSVALELLTEKQLFLADEPTSGLDSMMSAKVIQFIKSLAKARNIPCIISLHQPRSSIWHVLDDVILLAPGGYVCFAGKQNEALAYFEKLGYPCPNATNPADFLVDLISVDTEDSDVAAHDQARVEALAVEFRQYQTNSWNRKPSPQRRITSIASYNNNLTARCSIFRWIPRFGALIRRSWRQNIRNHTVNIFRLVASAVNAILLTAIFPTVRGLIPTPNSIADRVALLSFGAINMCFIAFMKTITIITQEKPVVRREQTRHQYSALEYLVAKIVAELPLDCFFAGIFTTTLKQFSGVCISWKKVTAVFGLLTAAGASLGLMLGSWTTSDELANTISVPILVVFMVVGIINPSGVDVDKPPPTVVTLLKTISPFAYAIEALCIGEYHGMKFRGRRNWFGRFAGLPKFGALAMVRDGDQVLQALGLAEKTFPSAMNRLGTLTIAYLVLSWIGLLFQQGGVGWKSTFLQTPTCSKGCREKSTRLLHDSNDSPTVIPVPNRANDQRLKWE